MKHPGWSRLLSVVLVLVLVFQLLPLSALAEEDPGETSELDNLESLDATWGFGDDEWNDSGDDTGDHGTSPEFDYDSEPEYYEDQSFSLKDVAVTGELEDLRSETGKHFRLEDGSYIAVDYGFPVHYTQASGVWTEIDNTMTWAPTLQSIEGGSFDTPMSSPVYVAVNGNSANAFAEEYLEAQPLYISSYNTHTVTFSFNGMEQGGSGGDVVASTGEPDAPETPDAMTEAPEATVPQETSETEPPETTVPQEAPETEPQETTTPQEPPETESQETTAPQEPTETEAPPDPHPEEAPEETVAPPLDESGSSPDETQPVPEGIPALVTNPDGTVLSGAGEPSPMPQSLEAPTANPTDPSSIELSKIGATVQYKEVLGGVDLQYELHGYDVKESIVILEPLNLQQYCFAFRMQLSGLTPELQSDGSVFLYDGMGELTYEIPAPFMTDDNQEASWDVAYSLRQEVDTSYILCITADADWINAPDRAYPVTIDPTLIVSSRNNSSYITTGFTRSGLPNTSGSGSQLYFGYGTGTYRGSQVKQMKALMYFGALPSIPVNCSVTGASVNFRVLWNGYSGTGLSQINAQLHQVTGNLPAGKSYISWVKNITWNTMPAYSDTVEDYCTVSSSSRGNYISWDISRVVASWYETGEAKRVLAMDAAESLSASRCAQVTMYTYGSVYYPYLVVQYRNNVGIEGYFTYQTASAGKAGTGYVSDYTSQLALANTVASSGSNTLPYGLTLYYNSAQRNNEFLNSDTAGIHTVNYSAMKTGAGWKLSIQESILKKTIATATNSMTYYVYNDADGTEHYFQITGRTSPYSDEDGLGLTLSVSGTECTLKDQKDNQKVFRNGYLNEIRDSNGNAIYLLYNGNSYSASSSSWKPASGTANYVSQIVRLNDGASAPSVLFRLAYSSGRLASITDAASRQTTFTYTQSGSAYRLTKITYPDGTTANYTYDSATGALLKAYDSEAKVGVGFTYRNFAKTLCVQKVREFAAASVTAAETVGNQWHLWVFSPYHKEYRFYGPDQVSDTADDTVVRYTFDHTGKTVNIVSLNHDKSQTLGVSTTTYTPESKTKTKNRVSGAAATGSVAVNLLNNSGFEAVSDSSSYGWIKSTAGSTASSQLNAAFRNYITENSANIIPYHGKYLLKTYVANALVSTTTSSACCAGMYQKVYLTAGTPYVFSAWANSSDVSYYGKDGGLLLQFRNGSGTVLASSDLLDSKSSLTVNKGWTRLEARYTPVSSGWYDVYAIQRNAYGFGAFDDMQLEISPSDLAAGTTAASALARESGASPANLVQLGSFELWNGTTPDRSKDPSYWAYTSSKASPITEGAKSGYSMSILGSIGEKRRATQTIRIDGSSDTTYVLSAWGKASSAPGCAAASEMTGDNSGKKRFFGIIAQINYSHTATPEYQYLTFDDKYTDWQYGSCILVPKQAGKTVTTIALLLAYDYNVNRAWFDNVSLVEEPAQTYAYDTNGNLASVSSTGNSEATYTYSGADLTKEIAGGYGTYTYTYYEGTHNLKTATNDGVTVTANYDAAGNTTQTTLRKTDNTGVYLQTGATATSDKNFTASVTDANGSTASYTYNNLGQLTGTTVSRAVDGTLSNVRTANGYDTDSGRQASTYINSVISLRYGYTQGTLSDVSRHSVTGANTWQRYHMTLDPWGNTTKLQVQGSSSTASETPTSWTTGITLASYEYGGSNGYLSKMTYANGDYERYTYDRYGRLAVLDHYAGSGVLNYSEVYVYDGNGNTARCTILNSSGAVTGEYRYEYDSLGRLIHSQALSGGASTLSTEHVYDTGNRLLKQTYQLGDKEFSEHYKYNSKDGSLITMTTATGDTLNYTYDSIKRLSEVSAKTGSTQNYKKTYTYATVSGNQTTTRVTGLQYSGFTGAPTFGYTYTKDGNIASNLKNGSTEYTYRYDNQGQLLEADGRSFGGIRYTYTYDAAGNLLTAGRTYVLGDDLGTNTYTYGNASWRDLLTAYNGKGIAYEGQTYNSSANTVSGTPTSGNPTSYYNGTRWSFAWSNGRQLTSASKTGTTVSYAYDQDSVRTTKTVNGVKHTYFYSNNQLLRETYGSTVIDFAYDSNGAPYSMTHNGTKYFYITNFQGDVINLVNSVSKTIVATYAYDPYGNVISATGTMANANPLRYRGYYYDSETGFYYLSARYYDPAICRFINADEYSDTADGFIGYNMFAYCLNNPVNRTDSNGNWSLPNWAKVVIGAVATVAAVAVTVATGGAAAPVLAGVAMSTAQGAISGFISGGVQGAIDGACTGFMIGGLTALASSVANALSATPKGCNSSSNCFIAGTLIQIEDGTKPIDEIQAGDYVWAWDEETGDVSLKQVVETYVRETEELVHVFANGEEIVTTPTHPFYSPEKGWTDAVHLRAGDILVLVNGEYVVVEKVQHELLENPVTVYNFQVEGYHTYYVANAGVLVHNKCGADHGNSLSSKKTNYGYELQDSNGNILKYGETTNPARRYSQSWLEKNNYSMKIMTSGSKQSVHIWQHKKILDYTYVAGHLPPLNRSLW